MQTNGTSTPTREALSALPAVLFRKGRNFTKADIFLWERPGIRLAVKDYFPRPAWVRKTIGRYLVSRECAAYARLRHIRGVPPFAGRIDSFAFALGFVEGLDLSQFRRGEVPAIFFDRLLALLSVIHSAGVAQGDLHHRDVLMDPSGEPVVVDFSTAILRDARAGVLQRRLFGAACASDRRAALKLKRRHAASALTDEEKMCLDHPPGWYRIGKRLRGWLR